METERRKAQLLEKRWKIKGVILHDKLSMICKSIQAFKDMGSQVAGLDPVHAGLPWAGFCLLMQLAVSESDQYAAMVAGVEEVAKVISRYKHVELICQSRQEVIFDKDFEGRLLELYEQILKYQVSAAVFYQRNTGARFLRSIPKLDDVSDVLAQLRRSDLECMKLLQLLFTKDELIRHSDILLFLNSLKEDLATVSQTIREMSKGKLMPPETRPSIPFAFDPDPKFTGRMDVIEELDAGFKTYRRMALVGWAGIGKSQIAIEYAHRVHKRSPLTRIFWVRGARRDVFLKSCRDLARQLQLPGWDDPRINVGKLFGDWLRDSMNGAWFLVIDNVDDETVFSCSSRKEHSKDSNASFELNQLHRYLPQVSYGSILVTSRNRVAARDITNEDDCIISVDHLPEPDALSLLRKKLPKDKSSDEDAKELVSLLEKLPLAITQAAAYVSKGSGMRTISSYLKLFRSDQVRCLEMAANDIRRDSDESDQDFSNSVLKTWFISFKHIKAKNPDAAENLCFMSLVFGQGIPMEYFLCGDEVKPHDIEEGIGPLIEFSLITLDTGGTFSIHRLVQLSVQHWLHTNDDFARNVEIAVSVLWSRFPYAQQETWRTCELLMPHVDVVLGYEISTPKALEHQSLLFGDTAGYFYSRGNWSLSLERASEALRISSINSIADFHVTRFKAQALIILAHESLGNNKQAENLARSLATSARQSYPDDDWKTMEAIHLLGRILISCGKYKEAEAVTREAVRLREIHLGEDHPQTLVSLGSLANVLGKQSDFAVACQLEETLVTRSTKAKGPTDSNTLTFINNYCSTLISMGRFQEAERLLWGLYIKRVESHAEDHPGTILNLANYVLALTCQSKHIEAQRWNDHALYLTKKNKSEGITSLLLLHNRGYIYLMLDRAIEARDCMKEVVRLREEHLGDLHPDTLMSIDVLGHCELVLGNYKAAEASLKHSWKNLEEQLGEDHYFTILAAANVALLRRRQGRLDESEALARTNLTISQRILGLHHKQTLGRQNNLARVLASKQQYKLAGDCISDALKTSTQQYGGDDPQTLTMKHTYASILFENVETYHLAENAYQELLRDYSKCYSDTYSDFVIARSQYASLLCKLSKFEEAEELSRENVTICQSTLGQITRTTCNALEGLAFVLAQNRPSCADQSRRNKQSEIPAATNASSERERRRLESLKLRKQVIEIDSKLLGYDEEPTLRSRQKLASFFEEESDHCEALRMYQSVMIERQRRLGLDDPETLDSSHRVAGILRKMARYSEAEAMFRQTWNIRQRVLGHHDESTMASKNDLALCLRDQGNARQALLLDQELLDHKRHVFGPDSLEVLHTMNNLAMDHYDLDDYNTAAKLLEEVVIGRKKMLGPLHDSTLLSTYNLGLNLQKQQRWREAGTVFCEILDIRTSVLGYTHHLIVETVATLSSCLRKQDKKEDAIKLAEESLHHHERELRPSHAKTLSALEFLATTLYLCEQWSRAESTYKQLFRLRKQTPDKTLSSKLQSFQDYTSVLFRLGKYSEAEPLCRRAHKGRQVILGIDHENTLFSAWTLVTCLVITKNRLPEAEDLCRTTIALREATVGKLHKQTLLMLQLLAFSLNLQGKPAENIAQLEDLESRLEESGQEPELHRTILQGLLNATYSSKDYVKAQSYGSKYLHLQEQTWGKDSLQAANVKSQLAVLSNERGLFQQSAQDLRSVVRIYETHSKTKDEEYLTSLTSLSEMLLRQENHDQRAREEAQLHCATAIDLDKSLSLSPTARPPVSFHSKARISRLLYTLGQYPESEAMARAVVTEGAKVLPANHTALLSSQRQVARALARTQRKSEALTLMWAAFLSDIKYRGPNDRGTLETARQYGVLLGEVGKLWEAELVLRVTLGKVERGLGEESPWCVETRREYVLLLIGALRGRREGSGVTVG